MILKNGKSLAAFEYDFAVDGGAVGVINLRPSVTELLAGVHIVGAYIIQETALVAVGGTVTVGNTTDPDGFFADIVALAASKNAIMAGEVAGALLWDDANDHAIAYSPLVADDFDVKLTVGTAAITAGKFTLYLELLG